MASKLTTDYPWIKSPLVCSAPMRLISHAPLAVEVSKAGGLGFIGSGNDQCKLGEHLEHARKLLSSAPLLSNNGTLPVGVGFLNWGADLGAAVEQCRIYKPAAVWLFAPHTVDNLVQWTEAMRRETQGASKIWIQVCSVLEALEVCKRCNPDVLVVQGIDAGGHGLHQGSGIISLLPETVDALQAVVQSGDLAVVPTILAAGGFAEGRGVAAALALGSAGVVMGTRYLAAHEAEILQGYKDEIIRASDGGQSTVRTHIYDRLRGTTDWPKRYGGRGVINQSYHDAQSNMAWDKNIELYEEALRNGDKGWGPQGRLTTYAGTAVGLVKKQQSAKEITEEVRDEAVAVVRRLNDTVTEL